MKKIVSLFLAFTLFLTIAGTLSAAAEAAEPIVKGITTIYEANLQDSSCKITNNTVTGSAFDITLAEGHHYSRSSSDGLLWYGAATTENSGAKFSFPAVSSGILKTTVKYKVQKNIPGNIGSLRNGNTTIVEIKQSKEGGPKVAGESVSHWNIATIETIVNFTTRKYLVTVNGKTAVDAELPEGAVIDNIYFDGETGTDYRPLYSVKAEVSTGGANFLDIEGNLIAVQEITDGRVEAPEYDLPEGINLVGWNDDYGTFIEDVGAVTVSDGTTFRAVVDTEILTVATEAELKDKISTAPTDGRKRIINLTKDIDVTGTITVNNGRNIVLQGDVTLKKTMANENTLITATDSGTSLVIDNVRIDMNAQALQKGGRAISVEKNAEVTLKGNAEIKNGWVKHYDCAVYINERYSKFTLEGNAKITGFVPVEGATITGIIGYCWGGQFIMNGGEISGNTIVDSEKTNETCSGAVIYTASNIAGTGNSTIAYLNGGRIVNNTWTGKQNNFVFEAGRQNNSEQRGVYLGGEAELEGVFCIEGNIDYPKITSALRHPIKVFVKTLHPYKTSEKDINTSYEGYYGEILASGTSSYILKREDLSMITCVNDGVKLYIDRTDGGTYNYGKVYAQDKDKDYWPLDNTAEMVGDPGIVTPDNETDFEILTVTFTDENGVIIDKRETIDGIIIPPEYKNTLPIGKVFAGWKDGNGRIVKDFTKEKIKESLVFTANIENLNDVTFFDEHGELLAVIPHINGKVTPPEYALPEGKLYVGWRSEEGYIVNDFNNETVVGNKFYILVLQDAIVNEDFETASLSSGSNRAVGLKIDAEFTGDAAINNTKTYDGNSTVQYSAVWGTKSNYGTPYMAILTPVCEGKMKVSFDIFEGKTTEGYIGSVISGSITEHNVLVPIMTKPSSVENKLIVYTIDESGNERIIKTIKSQNWQTISYILSIEDRTYTVSLENGEALTCPFKGSGNADRIYFGPAEEKADNDSVIRLDNIRFNNIWSDDYVVEGGENTAVENIYAEFEKDYLLKGENILNLTGENTSAEPMSVQVIFALYNANGVLEKTEIGEQNTVEQGGSIDITEIMDLSAEADLSGKTLKAYLWSNMTDIIPVAQAVSPTQTAFTFTIYDAAATSAGVYDEEGRLIRTLWSAVSYDAGEYTKTWNGLDDFGNAVPDGNYTVKVLSNNVEYEKLVPVIGNTSDCLTWDSFISSYNSIFDMAVDKLNNRIYYCSDHVEGGYGMRYLNADNIHRNGALLKGNGGNNTATHSATDGERVYWGVAEPTIYRNDTKIESFVFATYNEVDANGVETSGKKYEFTEDYEVAISKWGNRDIYSHALNLTVTTEQYYNRIGGVEVQQDGNYLLSAFRDAGKVYVNNKISGKDLFSYDVSEPSAMAMSRGGGSLDNTVYIAYNKNPDEEKGFAIAKYTINSDGSLTKEADVITGYDTILAMAASPDGSTLAFAQGGAEDKVFVYNTSDFSLKAAYGSGESYYTDPTVYDDKLMFDDGVFDYGQEPYEHSFMEFTDNDSVFVGDSGNTRVLLLDVSTSAPTIEDYIAFQSNTYNASVVSGEETRIFSENKEYSIDYEKMEEYIANRADRLDYEGFRDAWRLEKNYALYMTKEHPEITGGICRKFYHPYKAANGYTYFGMGVTGGKQEIYKMAPNGIITDTGVDLTNKDIHPDGSIWYRVKELGVVRYYCMKLSGYDENQNPYYGEPILLAEIDMNNNNHIPTNSYETVAVTDSDKLIVLDAPGPAITDYSEKHFQLGGIDISGGTATEFEWLAAPATLTRNQNDFPRDGYFDLQGPPQYTARHALAYGENIIFHYRGEGYKSAQANTFLHFNDDGLLIGVYGVTLRGRGDKYDDYSNIIEAQPCNSMSTSIVGIPGDPDTAYIYQNTEGAAGGVHITRVTGLTSLKEQDIPVVLRNGMADGIAYTCYASDNLDITAMVKKGTANNFNIPFITEETGTDRSVRFEGYFIPERTDTYRFATNTDGKVKILLDNISVIDGEGVEVAYAMLEENRRYKMVLEASPSSAGNLSYFDVSYNVNGETYYLDSKQLACEYPKSGIENRINLLDGFTYASDVEEGRYGWSVKRLNEQEGNSVSLTTNVWNYRFDDAPDLFMSVVINKQGDWFSQKELTTEVQINRNLGTVNSENWKIDMDLRHMGEMNQISNVADRPRGYYGSFIELLDKNDKVIANLAVHAVRETGQPDKYKVLGNGSILFEELVKPSQQYYTTITYDEQQQMVVPNRFTVEPSGDGYVLLSFAGGEPERVRIADSEADVSSPKTLSFVWYNDWALNINMRWNVTRFDFIRDTTIEELD